MNGPSDDPNVMNGLHDPNDPEDPINKLKLEKPANKPDPRIHPPSKPLDPRLGELTDNDRAVIGKLIIDRPELTRHGILVEVLKSMRGAVNYGMAVSYIDSKLKLTMTEKNR